MTKVRRTIVVASVAMIACALWFGMRKPRATRPRAVGETQTASPEQAGPPAYLARSSTISGEVRTTHGAPIKAARVCATDAGDREFVGPAGVCTESGENGRYVLTDLRPGSFVIRASAMGFVPGTADHGRLVAVGVDDSEEGVDVVLEDGGADVTGVVVDATGGPVSHATIRITPPMAGNVVEVEADEAGHFAASVSPGPMVLTAFATGYANGQQVRATAPVRGLVVILVPGSSVSGFVVSAVDGQAVAAVTVRAVQDETNSGAGPSTTSQGDGAFILRGLKPGTYELVAEGPRWSGGAAQPLDVGLLASLQGVMVRVQPAQRVLGKVVLRTTGEPCRTGDVVFDAPGQRELVSSVAGDGHVTFRGVRPGRYAVKVECAGNILREGPVALDVGKDDVIDVVWKVAAGVGLAISVVDETQQPVPWAEVRLELPSSSNVRLSRTLTVDGTGHFDYPTTLEAGSYRLSAAGTYQAQPVVLDLREGTGTTQATLRLEGSGAIVVNVRSDSGEPIDGVKVVAKVAAGASNTQPPGTATATASVLAPGSTNASAPPTLDGDPYAFFDRMERDQRGFAATALGGGQYRIGPLKPGEYRVLVAEDEGALAAAEPRSVTVAPGVAKTTVVLNRSGSIRGRVIDREGVPVPDVWVSAVPDLGDAGVSVRTGASPTGRPVVTGADGTFALDHLARRSRFAVRAQQPGAGDAVRGGVVAGDYDVTLTLAALGALGGTAVDDQGRPVARFSLATQEADANQARTVPVANQGGDWTAERIPAGHVRVMAIDDDSRVAFQEVDVVPGQRLAGVRLLFSKIVAPR